MNLTAFQSTDQSALRFQIQEIMTADMESQKWIEMLYRPQNLRGNINVEHYFKSLSTQQKIDLDIEIFNQIPRMLAEHEPNRLSVNLAPISLLSEPFRNNLLDLIKHKEIQADRVCIEIVEIHSMPTLSSGALEVLELFRHLGGWLALDDFGSGFAHWELLQMGMIDVIKVANQNLTYRNESASFTAGLAKFAQSMGINTVLEGVETQMEFEKGKKQGFKNFQGWFFNG